MKEKIMYLIIGILIGAIITTTGFLIYDKKNKSNYVEEKSMSNMGKPPERLDSTNLEIGEPPEKPDSNSSEIEDPPSKPEEKQVNDDLEQNKSKLSTSEASNS